MKQHHRMALGYCITILGGICWAIGGACGQTLFEQNRITSDWVVPIRLLLAGTLLVLFSALSGKHPMAVWKDKKNYPPLIAFGLIGSALCQYMAPVMILVYTVVKERRAPRGYELAAVLLVALGAFSCATQFKLGALHIAPLALIWGLLSAVAFAFYTITPQKLIQEYSLLPIVGWGMILGGIVLALLCRPWTVAVTVNAHLFIMLAGVIFLGTICSFCFYQAGVSIVGGLAGSILFAAEPVTSVMISTLLLHVLFTSFDLAGFVMILTAIPLIAVGEHWSEKQVVSLRK